MKNYTFLSRGQIFTDYTWIVFADSDKEPYSNLVTYFKGKYFLLLSSPDNLQKNISYRDTERAREIISVLSIFIIKLYKITFSTELFTVAI